MSNKKTLGNVDKKLKELEKREKAHEREDDKRLGKVKKKKNAKKENLIHRV